MGTDAAAALKFCIGFDQPKPGSCVFSEIVAYLRGLMGQLPDRRTGTNLKYPMADIGLGAFSVFFTQSGSFLDFQRLMQERFNKNNAQTLFGIKEIPTDNHIRTMLDGIFPQEVFPAFDHLLDRLKQNDQLEKYRSNLGDYLIAVDGVEFFRSEKICCKECSITTHRNAPTEYSHKAITPAIVAPGCSSVLPLKPEFIVPQDGHKKQDCENAAAKRWLKGSGAQYQALGITILGDDLYAHQPVCEAVLEAKMNFIFTCKPTSHETLFNLIDDLHTDGGIQSLTRSAKERGKKLLYSYRFVNDVPLRSGPDAIDVNWCEVTVTCNKKNAKKKQIFHCSYVTNHKITAANIANIIDAGRARWKIENENNNTLKNLGYHLEHNFGHGKQHLANLFATLNLVAFLFHTVLDHLDRAYASIRARLSKRKTFFYDFVALTRYHCFAAWYSMMKFMMEGLEISLPP